MSRRFRPTDAFVDESVRRGRYIMSCVLIEARHLAGVRLEMDGLRHRRRRIHFHNESERRRRDILRAIAEMPVRTTVVVGRVTHGRREFDARAECLAFLVERLQSRGVGRLVIESRGDDRDDVAVIQRARAAEPRLVFEHRLPVDEPLLWIADALAWAAGAGRAWSDLVAPVLDGIDELGP